MIERRNTEHDEELVRATWRGEEWLGVESMRAPQHGEPRRVLSGTYPTSERRRAGGRRADR